MRSKCPSEGGVFSEIIFAVKSGYAFASAKSEYGTLSLPNIFENIEPVKRIVISLKDLTVHKGDFIYFYIVSNDNEANSFTNCHIRDIVPK